MSWSEKLSHAYVDGRAEELALFLERMEASDVAAFLQSLSAAKAARLFTCISPRLGAQAYTSLEKELRIQILEAAPINVAGALLRRLGKEQSAEALASLSKARRAGLKQILSFAEDSAGGLMNPSYPSVVVDMSASQAIAALRGHERSRVSEIYALDRGQKLVGTLASSDLLLSDGSVRVGSLVTPLGETLSPFVSARSLLENEELIRRRSLPVVTEDGVYLGAISHEQLLNQVTGVEASEEDPGREDAARSLANLFKLGVKSLVSLVEERRNGNGPSGNRSSGGV